MRLQYESNPCNRTKEALDEAKQCLMKCKNAIYNDRINDLVPNQAIIDSIQIRFANKDKPIIRICCCPNSIDKERFAQHFLAQLNLKYAEILITD